MDVLACRWKGSSVGERHVEGDIYSYAARGLRNRRTHAPRLPRARGRPRRYVLEELAWKAKGLAGVCWFFQTRLKSGGRIWARLVHAGGGCALEAEPLTLQVHPRLGPPVSSSTGARLWQRYIRTASDRISRFRASFWGREDFLRPAERDRRRSSNPSPRSRPGVFGLPVLRTR